MAGLTLLARGDDAERLRHLLGRCNESPAGCLEYQGCIQSNGYARATVRHHTDYAHRHVYRLAHGSGIPPGFDVCHKCDNRRCINPEHLFLGTRKDNMRDAVSKGRQAKGDRLPQFKVSQFVEQEIARLARAGLPYKVIAQQFGICRQHAGQVAIRNGVVRNGLSK